MLLPFRQIFLPEANRQQYYLNKTPNLCLFTRSSNEWDQHTRKRCYVPERHAYVTFKERWRGGPKARLNYSA